MFRLHNTVSVLACAAAGLSCLRECIELQQHVLVMLQASCGNSKAWRLHQQVSAPTHIEVLPHISKLGAAYACMAFPLLALGGDSSTLSSLLRLCACAALPCPQTHTSLCRSQAGTLQVQ